MGSKFGAVLVVVSLSFSAFAATNAGSETAWIQEFQNDGNSLRQPAANSDALKIWKKKVRKPAANMEFTKTDVKPDVDGLVKDILSVDSADALGAKIEALKAYFPQRGAQAGAAAVKASTADFKFFAAHILLLQNMRGIVWRLRPIFEKGDGLLGNRASHISAVSLLRRVAGGVDMYLPTEEWNAGFDYLTIPSATMSKADQFKNVNQFQAFMASVFYADLMDARNRIAATLNDANTKGYFVWDNRANFGRGSFTDGFRQYTGYGYGEVKLTLSSLEKTMHSVLSFSAYNQNDLLKAAKNVGELYGIDIVFRGDDNDLGITSRDRAGAVRKAGDKFLALYNNKMENCRFEAPNGSPSSSVIGGQCLMWGAYAHLKASVDDAGDAYYYYRSIGFDTNAAFNVNAAVFSPSMQPHLSGGIENLRKMVIGRFSARDPITADAVTVNIPAFYTNPPVDMKKLLPVAWVGGEKEYSVKNNKNETLKYRNYRSDLSSEWSGSAWQKLFPELPNGNTDKVRDFYRIVSMSYGGSLLTAPMQALVR